MITLKLTNPPANMHADQQFEDKKHLTAWLKEQTDAGTITKATVLKNKIKFSATAGDFEATLTEE